MWGIPFILEPNQTLTCIMSSHSTNLEPKSWLTMNLDPGWECQSLPSEAKKKRRKISNQKKKRRKISNQGKKEARKFPIKEREKEKKREVKEKKAPGQRNHKKCAERSLDQTISEQYRIVTKWTKERKGNHNLKWSSPFDCQPKSRALATLFSRPALNQKQKKEKPEKSKAKNTQKPKKKPPKEPIPKGSPIDPWSRM